MPPSWPSERVVVTGGAGFLGSRIVEALRARGAREVFVPRSKDYDLVDMEAVRRLYRAARPTLLVHCAAIVGGIGANRASPGRFFYDNLTMYRYVDDPNYFVPGWMGLPKDTDVTGATRPPVESYGIDQRADLGPVLNQDVELVAAVRRGSLFDRVSAVAVRAMSMRSIEPLAAGVPPALST